jgi:GTP cyclohydrolase I
MPEHDLEKCHTKLYLEEYSKNRDKEESVSSAVTRRLKQAGKRFFANDNISEFISETEKEALIKEATVKFAEALKTLIIDIDSDPNSEDTPYRLAKMYFTEIMSGRYDKVPKSTAFPNTGEEKYKGMLVVRADIKSICSHHHQPVWGTAFIGVILDEKALGLSKYTRIAQWTARRGTLQEQLCSEIAKNISKEAATEDVAVYIECSHGCCTFRGIGMSNSTTQTTVLKGAFKEADVKKEFFDNIQLQKVK